MFNPGAPPIQYAARIWRAQSPSGLHSSQVVRPGQRGCLHRLSRHDLWVLKPGESPMGILPTNRVRLLILLLSPAVPVRLSARRARSLRGSRTRCTRTGLILGL